MKVKLIYLALLAGMIFSCQDNPDPLSENHILINTDSEELSKRLSLDGSGVIGISSPANPSGRVMNDEDAEKFSLVLISHASSPTHEGNTLQATHIDIEGNYAYVGYNTAGSTYLGAVEIIDISDPYKPKIVSQAILEDSEVSALEYRDGQLFLAMAIDVDKIDVTEPANLGVVSVSEGKFTSDFRFVSVPGFVATDVTATSDFIALVSGSNGNLTVFDRNLNLLREVPIEDLRSVATDENRLAVLSGTKGASIFNSNSQTPVTTIGLEQDVPQTKRTIDIEDGHLYISEGKNGAGVYNLSSGQQVTKLAIPINPENVEPGDIVTNAVSVDGGLMFMANGAAGVSIALADDVEQHGVLDLDGSSNFVRFENKFIFVATGAGGIQILKMGNDTEETEDKCEDLEAYSGSSNLNVNGNESAAFRGSAQLKNVNIGGNFLFCGSLAIENSLNVNSNGLMEVYGSFAFGQYKKNTSINVNSKSVLRLSGSTVIYGDLRLNSGAKLEFVGDDNTITIYGDVTVNSGASISGNFNDTEGKLK
ncbi:hypothetical protein [Algoriphagus sp. A40]|uniref:hypothetical protein n=1 Tax=Algoriphagus sp. A40 TaxID=1945863 RepID=UPI000985163D|nr:hypothetical protein [Algoriphagus sp. A40]OOG76892.1 hypothetical protein B0E43_06715 [Algoriphagus sp. A40]